MNRRRTTWLAVPLALALAVGVAGCGSDDDAAPTTTAAGGAAAGSGPLAVDAVAVARLDEPTVLLARPGERSSVWVALRSGRVRRLAVANGGRKLTPTGPALVDISRETTIDSERGLLGMAFSPEGDELFLSYTNREGNTRVDSFAMDGDSVDLGSRRNRFGVAQPYPNHNGGNIAFGPDGKLWLGLGDGGLADDPENRAQDPSTPLGKVIRLDVLHGGRKPEPEIVISGVRNPWRWAFDTDGSLWIGDVGQNHVEEVDHLPADQIEGANLGWSGYEGSEPYLDGDGRRPAQAIAPVFEYQHEDGNCSITGGFAYRGKAIPALDGAFLFADYCGGRLRAVRLDGSGAAKAIDLGIDLEQPISFGRDANGEAYVLTQGGEVLRLIAG